MSEIHVGYLLQVLLALIVAAPPTIAIVLTHRASVKKTDIIVAKVEEVHTLANDRLTKALNQIDELDRTVGSLRSK